MISDINSTAPDAVAASNSDASGVLDNALSNNLGSTLGNNLSNSFDNADEALVLVDAEVVNAIPIEAISVLRITGAFGISGFLRAIAFSDNLSSYKELCTKDGRTFAFRLVRYVGGRNIIINLDGIKDRNQALALKGTNLYVKRENLEKVKSPNEYYVCDLIGKKVEIGDHSSLNCKIVSVHNFGAGDLIEILYQNDTFMVPFREEYFPHQEDRGQNDALLMTFEAFCNFKC